jgi:beta-glucosidase
MKDEDAVANSGHMLPSEQAAMVESVISRGQAGALLLVSDAAQINRLQRLVIDGNRLGIPALFGYDVIHG